MIQNLEWYSAFPLATGIMALVLGIAVYRKNRKIAIVNGFLVLMLIFLVVGILDFLMINASDQATAILLARGVVLCLVLISAGFLYLSTQLAFIPLSKWLQRNWILYSVLSLLIGLVVAYGVIDVDHGPFGYGLPFSWESAKTLVVMALFGAATLSLLVRRWYLTADGSVRNECLLLSLAVLMPYLWGLFLLIIDMNNFHTPSVLSPGFFVSIVIMALSIYRHRLLTVMPVSEDRNGIKGAKGAALLPLGSYLLFEETKADGMFDSLLSQVSNGCEGLIVTRTYPEDLREKYGLKRTPVIWLCSQPGQDWIDPTNLSILEHTIVEFLKMGRNTVVAIDGLEYLISNNSSTKILRMLYGLRDEVLMNESRMLITLDPRVLDIKELALFERDFEVVRKL